MTDDPLDLDAVSAMTGLHLNVGCGEFKAAKPWINIDSNAGRDPDVVANVLSLPYEDNSARHIYAGHVIEHLDWWTQVPQFLMECRRVLVAGGTLVIVAPDIERARLLVLQGSQPESLIKDIEAGGERWDGDYHQWTADSLNVSAALWWAGWNAREIPISDPALDFYPCVSRAPWQCAFIATNTK